MIVLLDTHIVLWMWSGDKRLSRSRREFMASEEVSLMVSIVSIWEIAIRSSLGKLELKAPLEELVASLPAHYMEILPLALDHIHLMRTLPLHHRDPFDRMLIAQAKHEGMHLLTADPQFGAYDVSLVKV